MSIKPLFDKVVIKVVEADEKTSSGIVLPSASKERPQMAKVLAVGPGGSPDANGNAAPMQVKVGDTVLFSKYAGSEFKIDGEEVVIIRQADILAIIE